MLTCKPEPGAFAGLTAELSGRLGYARTELAVWDVLGEYACGYLGAAHVLVLRRTQAALADVTQFSAELAPPELGAVERFSSAARLAGMGLVARPPASCEGGPFAPLFRALPQAGGGVVYAEVTAGEVLLLIYPTTSPVLSRHSWVLLDSMRQLGTAALGRVRGRDAAAGGSRVVS